jgi:iron-sulfur cluster repair protein YtfE (RIC family)
LAFSCRDYLNKSNENNIDDYIVVDFRNVYGIQIENLKEIAGKLESIHRLLPPYREPLSQAFARYFMRVGLPQNIVIESY